MSEAPSAMGWLRAQYRRGEADPVQVMEAALAHSNSNAEHNVYLEQDAAWSLRQAMELRREDFDRQPLWGVPVSLKDCFDLAGFHTSCGTRLYRERNGVAGADSEVARRLRAAGAIVMGKTHLHPLAYGITGENPDFGDCVQPRDAGRLTGGSSSGAAASVQEGSALAAIGTDTGGSIRVPAALCGVAGYRSSLSLQRGLWSGGAHLAESFDTVGWLYRDAADGAVLAQALLGIEPAESPAIAGLRIGTPQRSFLHDCEDAIMERMEAQLGQLRERGAVVAEFDAQEWGEAMEIFAPIQASEAARLHAGNFEKIEVTIAQRLAWGASLGETEIAKLRLRLANFRTQGRALMERFDLLVLPCSPLAKLEAGADHAQTRARILRYTAPVSLCGWPVVTLPGEHGGLQLVGRMGSDAELLALSARLAEVAAADGGSARLHA